ncbi:hypothetical protein K438DRAFT_1781346 [Mycena galopus ATCC 62051]|nr:hypothetical protein K438DRAFT_1781346 [Mycena galopus ATCC 62051]
MSGGRPVSSLPLSPLAVLTFSVHRRGLGPPAEEHALCVDARGQAVQQRGEDGVDGDAVAYIFDDVDAFQERPPLARMAMLLPSARLGAFISILHTILQLFIPKRTKINVLGPFLPPKKSYISFYVRLSTRQRGAYEAVRDEVAGGARAKGASASSPAGMPFHLQGLFLLYIAPDDYSSSHVEWLYSLRRQYTEHGLLRRSISQRSVFFVVYRSLWRLVCVP